MTEQRMDDITTLKPAATIAGAPAMAPATEPTEHSAEQKPVSMDTERPPNEHTIEPLEISEDLPVRSKLRIYTILIALSVDYPVLTPSKRQLANDNLSSSNYSLQPSTKPSSQHPSPQSPPIYITL